VNAYYKREFREKIREAAKDIAAAGSNRKKIEGILSGLMTESEARNIVTDDGTRPMILWVAEDVKTLRPRWSTAKCEAALADARKSLCDRGVEDGWEVLGYCIREFEG